ncbi:MAG: AAA family ATPase, partial [Burkholderia vietnamiensis]|nr:AAA family ATPase [Burkholderia vietnamiensis]
LHILAGAPGQGKTTINLAFAATVTVGGRWPDGTRCEAGNVLIWSGEDDPADTLLPRLLAMGADPGRVFFVTATRVDGEVVPFDPARDMVQLTAEAERIGGDDRTVLYDFALRCGERVLLRGRAAVMLDAAAAGASAAPHGDRMEAR